MPQVSYAGLFPFCITPTDDASLVGDGTWYPLGFTKEEVCALYWKNKSYNIACTDSGLFNYTNDYSFDWDRGVTGVANYVPEPTFFAPTIETDFICADVVSKIMAWYGDPFTGNEGQVYLFGYEFWNGSGYTLTTNCYYYNNQYYPLIAFFSPLGYVSISDYAIVVGGWTQAQVDLISVTATCTFLGRNVPVYYSGTFAPSYFRPQPDGSPDIEVFITDGTVNGSLVVTLDTQWPYNP
jgi:hypothetical protein